MIKKWNARLYFPGFFPDLFSQDVVSMIFSHTSSHTNKVFPRLVPLQCLFLKSFLYDYFPDLLRTLFVPWFFPKFLTSAIKFPRFPPENLHSSVPNFQPKQKRPVIEASGWNKTNAINLTGAKRREFSGMIPVITSNHHPSNPQSHPFPVP